MKAPVRAQDLWTTSTGAVRNSCHSGPRPESDRYSTPVIPMSGTAVTLRERRLDAGFHSAYYHRVCP
jgi:hypothetical protein